MPKAAYQSGHVHNGECSISNAYCKMLLEKLLYFRVNHALSTDLADMKDGIHTQLKVRFQQQGLCDFTTKHWCHFTDQLSATIIHKQLIGYSSDNATSNSVYCTFFQQQTINDFLNINSNTQRVSLLVSCR